jgi:hypothetical protein
MWKNGQAEDVGVAPILGAQGNLDTQEFSTQGIGVITTPPVITS